jgi:hypothetical protein
LLLQICFAEEKRQDASFTLDLDAVYASCLFGGLPPNISIAAIGGVPYGSLRVVLLN